MLNIEELVTRHFINEEGDTLLKKENIYKFAFNLSPQFAQE